MTISGWRGVDLDGTLAYYDTWRGAEHIGNPIPMMVDRVKGWLAKGETVKIFTARVSAPQSAEGVEFIQQQTQIIQDWCEKHLGQRLEVTCQKDFACIEIWDDRAVQVAINTGQTIVQFNNDNR